MNPNGWDLSCSFSVFLEDLRKCYQHNSPMLFKGVFLASLLKKLLIHHMLVSHLLINKSHFCAKKVIQIYQFDNVRPSLLWKMMEGRNPGVQAATANSFTATDFQLKKYVHPMPTRLTSLYTNDLHQVLPAAALRELSVCSNFRASMKGKCWFLAILIRLKEDLL